MAQRLLRSTHSPDPAATPAATRGFTIVELLVVIVVIAILAAITIVAYNGIQNRARTASVSSALNQAAKKLALFSADNSGSYPSSSTAFFTEVGADSSGRKGDVELQYSVSNSTDPKSYCVTGTVGSLSMKVTQSGAPATGGCAGHGQAGSPAVTNLIANPSFETTSGSSVVGFPSSGRATAESSTVGALAGEKSLKITPTYASSTDTFIEFQNFGVEPSTTYTAILHYTLLEQLPNSNPRMRFNVGGSDLQSPSGSQTVGSHQIRWTFTSGPSTSVNFLRIMPGGKAGDPPVYFDKFMIVKGDYGGAFADGSSPNWIWNGSPNGATSTGPAL